MHLLCNILLYFAREAVRIVREGGADILMKGIINTDNLLHAILDKEKGLLPKGKILTHLAVMEIPTYHKLLFFSDAAVIPSPIIRNSAIPSSSAREMAYSVLGSLAQTTAIRLSEIVGLSYSKVIQ